jgi:amino acid adenylation domain-containing protein
MTATEDDTVAGLGTRELPLTPLQSVMAFESLRDPESDAHWIVLAYEIPGDWPAERLRAAWAETVRAHPALRTRFVSEDGLRQVIGDAGPALAVVEWDAIRASHADARAWFDAELARARRQGAFDSQRVSAVRGYVSEADGRPCVLFGWALHHLLADGSSLVNALNDFFALLAGGAKPPERPSVAVYHDWLARHGAAERSRQHWTRVLTGVAPARPLRLAADAPSGGPPDLRTLDFRLPAAASAGLAGFARRHRVSQAAVVTALWARLLTPYQDGAELCVGMTFSTRPAELPSSGDISAMLINTLPLRIDTGRPFAASCSAVMAQLLAGAEHAHLSYNEVVAAAGLPAATRLFHSTVIVENFAGGLAEAGRDSGLPVAPRLVAELGTSADPLTLTVDLSREEFVARLGWDEALFDGARCRALARRLAHWLRHLDVFDDEADAPPALLTPAELAAWRSTYERHVEPEPWDVAELWREHDHAGSALRDDETELRYAELATAVPRLAGWLRERHGVTRGSRVALIGGRGVRGAIALLAVWWLGAAWCPLDASVPPGHRRRVLDVLAPDAVIELADLPALGELPAADVTSVVMAQNDIAYYVATSGTTGEPKLAALTAGGLAPLTRAWRAEYGARSQHVLQLGSWAADVFLGDLLKALATGGCLTIVPNDRRTDLDHLADSLTRHQITFVESTPRLLLSMLRRLDERGDRPRWLRTLVAGSDTFRESERFDAIRLLWPGVRLVNGYGLSEATIESTVFDCTSERVSPTGLCPIGRPLPGSAIRVVDERSRQVPPGAAGELLVGGPQVGIGYLTGDGLDRGRIVELDGVRWLRTGDRAVANADGVDFLGRADTTVKVRGHRVELGAVENALLTLDGVDEAAVIAADDRLVAFVSGARELTPGAVIAHARGVLPAEAAVPGLVAVLDRLPRNANQKIDRTMLAARVGEALPAAGVDIDEDATCEVPGEEPGERNQDPLTLRATLIAVWSGVLGRQAHPRRTFFDQGGHSMLALTLLERLRRELPDYRVDMGDLFRHPTIDALHAELERRLPQRKPA